MHVYRCLQVCSWVMSRWVGLAPWPRRLRRPGGLYGHLRPISWTPPVCGRADAPRRPSPTSWRPSATARLSRSPTHRNTPLPGPPRHRLQSARPHGSRLSTRSLARLGHCSASRSTTLSGSCASESSNTSILSLIQ